MPSPAMKAMWDAEAKPCGRPRKSPEDMNPAVFAAQARRAEHRRETEPLRAWCRIFTEIHSTD